MTTDYVTIKIPRSIQPQWSAAVEISHRLNLMDCNKNPSDPSAMVDAIERILAEWLSEARPYYWDLVNNAIGDDELKRARMASLERDGYSCVICRKSECNLLPALESHHIIPRSSAQLAATLCGKLHTARNLVSLCHEHHDRITNPAGPEWHWRAIAPRLFELIGEPDLVLAMKKENNKDG